VGLAAGDACHFDAQALFGARFDRVVISFALSMIPEWEAALAQAIALLPPGGELHVWISARRAACPPLALGADGLAAAFPRGPARRSGRSGHHLAGSFASVETSDGPLGYYRRLIIRRNRGL
jgi:S-adenosylmethionine-diacylgycerolhomoserine-N-methlytransferase